MLHSISNFKLVRKSWAIVLIALFTCQLAGEDDQPRIKDRKMFGDYWYSGVAELTRYSLEQIRYGEIHKGDAVLIFVTEDFLPEEQVKYEFGPRPDNIESVLKLNLTRKFYTGLYPYSMMSSVFTPVGEESRRTLKVSTSVQEWCGHVYMQLNHRNGGYEGVHYSYFQAEGDRKIKLADVLLEDELMTLIRLNPDALPRGEIKLIPATQFLRLRHQEAAVEAATASLKAVRDPALSDKSLMAYRLKYHSFEREVVIHFESEFPYAILAWEETHQSGFGKKPVTLTTRARRTHATRLDYWSKHAVADSTYRAELGL